MHMDEEKFLEGLQNQDAKAFNYLQEIYGDYILKSCLRYVKDRDVANDLKQEVLIKVFLQIDHFRREARFKTWLYTIIHSTCVDYLRKDKKKLFLAMSASLANILPEVIENEDEVPKEIGIEIFNELLEELSPEGRLIIILKYREKHAIKDIQQAMGLSESAVKMRLKRAREMLKRLYQNKIKS